MYKVMNSWDWRVEHENGTGSAKVNTSLSSKEKGGGGERDGGRIHGRTWDNNLKAFPPCCS